VVARLNSHDRPSNFHAGYIDIGQGSALIVNAYYKIRRKRAAIV